MKSLSIDVTAGMMAEAWWTARALNSVRRWVSIEKNLHTRRLVAAPLLSSVALVLVLSACGGGGDVTTASTSLPTPAQPAKASISGNVRAPGGLIKIGIVGSDLAALDPVAADRQPSVMMAATPQLPGTSGVNFSPSVLKQATPRKPPPGCFPVPQKPVVLRTLQSFGPTYGAPIAQTTTDANGSYSINIPDGTSPTAVLIITVGADNEVQMSGVVTGNAVDIDPVTEAAFQVLMSYARRNNLPSISLDLTAELVGRIDDIAATMPVSIDSRSAANSYVQAAAGSAPVNSSLTAQLPSGTTGGSPIGGSGGTPIGGAGIAPGAPDKPPPPNPKPTGTWYAHFTVQVCVPGATCVSSATTAPGNNAYDAQATCLEGGRQVAAALNAAAIYGLTYSYICNQTP